MHGLKSISWNCLVWYIEQYHVNQTIALFEFSSFYKTTTKLLQQVLSPRVKKSISSFSTIDFKSCLQGLIIPIQLNGRCSEISGPAHSFTVG